MKASNKSRTGRLMMLASRGQAKGAKGRREFWRSPVAWPVHALRPHAADLGRDRRPDLPSAPGRPLMVAGLARRRPAGDMGADAFLPHDGDLPIAVDVGVQTVGEI